MIEVEVKGLDGPIEFPDGTTEAEITAAIERSFPELSGAANQPANEPGVMDSILGMLNGSPDEPLDAISGAAPVVAPPPPVTPLARDAMPAGASPYGQFKPPEQQQVMDIVKELSGAQADTSSLLGPNMGGFVQDVAESMPLKFGKQNLSPMTEYGRANIADSVYGGMESAAGSAGVQIADAVEGLETGIIRERVKSLGFNGPAIEKEMKRLKSSQEFASLIREKSSAIEERGTTRMSEIVPDGSAIYPDKPGEVGAETITGALQSGGMMLPTLMTAPVSPGIGIALFAGLASGAKYKELERLEKDGKITQPERQALSAIAGGIEGVTEKFALDRLISLATGKSKKHVLTGVIKYMAAQIGQDLTAEVLQHYVDLYTIGDIVDIGDLGGKLISAGKTSALLAGGLGVGAGAKAGAVNMANDAVAGKRLPTSVENMATNAIIDALNSGDVSSVANEFANQGKQTGPDAVVGKQAADKKATPPEEPAAKKEDMFSPPLNKRAQKY